jgi:TonB-linked SusC/RagA family outer membrane protein
LGDKIQLEGDFLQNTLSLRGNFSFENTRNDISEKRVPVPYSLGPEEVSHVGENQNWLRLTSGNTNYIALNSIAEYKNTLGKHHNVDLTIGTNYETKRFNSVELQRNGLAFGNADNINLALGQGISTSGAYYEWKIFGAFYQLNYNYNHTYLLTLSGRYDGNSRFPSDQRYGFFPSFSAGWLLSEEPFWHVSNKFISELKIRGSYGSLGNGNISPYTYQQELPISQISNIINGKQPQAISNPAVLPSGLTWETVTTSDIGLDLGMFSDRLSFSGDAYIRATKNMFTQAVTPPRVFGADTPSGNFADLKTKGWGFTLSWADHINNVGRKTFSYKIGINVSNNRATITRFNNPTKNLDNYYVGERLGEIWGYVNEGFFQSEEQIKNHANQQFLNPHTPDQKFHVGGLKFKDLNGDGVIDDGENRVSGPGDRRIIGNSHPQYRFGINIHLAWSGFFVTGFFEGVGKKDWYPSSEADYFWGQYNRPYNQMPKWQLKKGMIWTKNNPHAFLPRYVGYEALELLSQPQARYLMNVAYIRLKNLQVGYNFSPKYLTRAGIQKAQIFVNGQNLWFYSPLHKIANNIDPESGIMKSESDVSGGTAGDGLNYPILRSVAVGINITF